MGFLGLLPLVKWAKVRRCLFVAARGRDVGLVAAVDAPTWLHEFAAKHAREVLLEKNYMPVAEEVLHRCLVFMSHGVKSILLFDGKKQPAKEGTNDARRRRRLIKMAEVEMLLDLSEGEDNIDIDERLLKVAAAVSFDMIHFVISHLRRNGWGDYIVAPYEADGVTKQC